jgi:hypothetical protein
VRILPTGLLTFVVVCIQSPLFLFVKKKDVPNSAEVYEKIVNFEIQHKYQMHRESQMPIY